MAFLFMSDSALSTKTIMHPEVSRSTEMTFSVYVDIIQQISPPAEQNYELMCTVWWNTGKLVRDIWQAAGLSFPQN